MAGTQLIPTFTTQRLTLRPITLSDAEAYEKHFVDYRVVRTLSAAVPWPYPKDGIVQFIKNHVLPNQGKGFWFWAICLKEKEDELIGAIELSRKAKKGNRGFWLGASFWNQGFMTEANIPVLNYAFTTLAFQRMQFVNAVGNVKSRRIKEKTGCRLLTTRPGQYIDPSLTTEEVWELTKADWQQYYQEHYAHK